MASYYFSRKALERSGEPIGDMSGMDASRRAIYHGGGKGDSPDPPDYSQMAAASAEAARLGKELGDAQLAENTRQYDQNTAIARPVIAAQLDLMNQTKAQGDDYYSYMVAKQRPVEDALNEEAMSGRPDAATRTAMQEASDKAVADTRAGSTQQINMIARQGLRYGFSPAKLAAAAGTSASMNASAQAAAANGAATKARTEGWAKRLDVAGLYRGLPGASQGAYSLANGAGNSAVGNQNQTSAQYINGMSAGNRTVMQGQGQRISGLGSVLGSQTSVFNNGSPIDNTGAFVGAAGGIAAAMMTNK